MHQELHPLLERLASQPFRAQFRLEKTDRTYVFDKGLDQLLRHAKGLIAKRLSPAEPIRDGAQTPYTGHPVFIAQHATATCCRQCLAKWHKIPQGRAMTLNEQAYVVDVIEAWLTREFEDAPRQPGRGQLNLF